MRQYFSRIKLWFSNHMPTKRRLIQIYTALLYNANLKGYIKGDIYKGETKYACVPGLNCYSCPGAVGSCPLGALQNSFAQSGTRAGYYIIGILGLFGLIFARTVCGFLCPVGLGQELLHKIPSLKIKKSRTTRALSYMKYVFLIVLVIGVPLLYGLQGIAVPAFCKYICPAGTFGGGLGLILNPSNWSGNRDLLNMLGPIFTWKFTLLCAIIVLCVFMYRPFCRFFCPLGAIYGFFNRIAFLGVEVDKIKCTDCGLCVKHCEMDIKRVGDHECINCGKCIKVCPVQAISWKGSKLFIKNGTSSGIDSTLETNACSSEKCNSCNSTSCKTSSVESKVSEIEHEITIKEMNTMSVETSLASEKPKKEKKKSKRGSIFWMRITAWTLALSTLLGAILYFNVFSKSEETSEIQIGMECPDFTLQRYGENESGKYGLLDDEFTLSDQKGSVVVINFWATWCGPCVAELPHFNQVASEYPEAKIVAIHGNSTEDVGNFIVRATDAKDSWRNYNLIFLQDKIENNICLTYQALGGISSWPMTLIADRDGKITFTRQGSLSYDKLKEELEKALNT